MNALWSQAPGDADNAAKRRRASRRRLYERLASIDAALGASVELPDVTLLRRRFRRGGAGLAIGAVGAASAFGVLWWTSVVVGEHAALMVLLIGVAFLGLALVALVALAGTWLESFSVTRLVLLQARLDLAEANEVAVASVDWLAALREIGAWTAPTARAELTDAVVAYSYERCEGVSFSALRVRYVKVATIARKAAPNEAAAERVLRALRPAGVDWPTTIAAAEQLGQS